MKGLGSLLPAVLLLPASQLAQPPLTRVEDVLYRADGSRASGAVRIVLWRPVLTSGQFNYVSATTRTVNVRDGSLSVDLVPNEALQPAGSFYQVVYALAGSPVGWSENWIVPVSQTPVRISDILAQAPSGWSGYLSRRPIRVVSSTPPTCQVGEYVFLSGAPPGLNTYACTSTNTWTLQGDGFDVFTQLYDVRSFGAVCNNSANDRVAIQHAIDSVPEGSVLFFPPGTCLTDSVLTLTKSLHLVGAGPVSVIRTTSSSNASVLSINTAARVKVSDLTFQGPTSATGGVLVLITAPSGPGNTQSRFVNVRFEEGWNHLEAQRVDGLLLSGCIFSRWAGRGVSLVPPSAATVNVTISHSRFFTNVSGASEAIQAVNASGVTVTGNTFINTPRSLYALASESGVSVEQLVYSDNRVSGIGSGLSTVLVETSNGGTYSQGTLSGNTSGQGLFVRLNGDVSHFTTIGNTVWCASEGTGIIVSAGSTRSGNSVANNTFQSCSVGISASNCGPGCVIGHNAYHAVAGFTPVSASANVIVLPQGGHFTAAQLGGWANGSMVYCSDCQAANPCTGGGSGAFARRINGSWVCN